MGKQLVDTNWSTKSRDIQSDNDYEEKNTIYAGFSFRKSNKVPRRYQRKVCIYGRDR